MKKSLSFLLVAMLLFSVSAIAEEKPIVINFLAAQYSDNTETYVQSVVDAFEESHPNVTINLEIAGWDVIRTRITAMIGSREAPDIFQGGSAAEYVADDLLYKASDVLSEGLQADFFKPFWENCMDNKLGVVFQIPYLASVRALYYSKAIFEEVGIEAPPATWTEVETISKQIHDFYKGEVYAWGVDASYTEAHTLIGYYGWNNGGGILDDEGNFIINSEANVEAIEWVYSLYKKGYTNENPSIESRDDLQKLMAAGKLAMLATANFFPALYPDLDLGIAPLPYNDAKVDSSTTLGVQDVVIFFNENAKSSEDTPEKMNAIQEFMDFFYSPEYYTNFMIVEGMLPATNSGAMKLVEMNPEQAAYIDVLDGAKFFPSSHQQWNDCMLGIKEAGQSIFSDLSSVQEALDAVQEELEN